MALSFPTSPTAGDQYVGDGVTYQYDGTLSAWIKLSPVQSALAGAAAQTGAAIIPGGTDAERAAIATPAAGMFRYNDQAAPAVMEYYDGTQWVDLATGGGGASLGEWELVQVPGMESVSSVAYGNGVYVAAGGAGTNALFSTSTDNGLTWTTATAGPAGFGTSGYPTLIFANGVFLTLRGGVPVQTATSPDGINWTTGATLADNLSGKTSAFAGGNGKFVALPSAGTAGKVYYSSDGQNWSLSNFANTEKAYTVTYGTGNEFLIVGTDSAGGTVKIYKSTDGGDNWSVTASNFFGSIGFIGLPFASIHDGTNYLFSIPFPGIFSTPDGTSPVWKRSFIPSSPTLSDGRFAKASGVVYSLALASTTGQFITSSSDSFTTSRGGLTLPSISTGGVATNGVTLVVNAGHNMAVSRIL